MTPLRKKALWLLVILAGTLTAYLGLLCLLSILVGLRHMKETGSWVPILVGTVSFAALLFLFFSIAKHIRTRIKEDDLVNI